MPANVILGPFNFYQFTGRYENQLLPVFPGVRFFTGHYFTEELKLGASYGYFWPLVNDSVLFPAEFSTIIHPAVVSGNNLRFTYDSSVTGTFYGYPKGTGEFLATFSSNVSGNWIMTGQFAPSITATIEESPKDTPSFLPSFSAAVLEPWQDRPQFLHDFSVVVNSNYNLNHSFLSTWSASLVPKDSDLLDINFALTAITFEAGPSRFNIDEEDSADISFSLVSLDYIDYG